MSAPTWSPIDDDTADLLALVAIGTPTADAEWDLFVAALRKVATANDGWISPNALRPLVRGNVSPRRVGAFTNRALKQGLVFYAGTYQISDDTEGRNAGKPARCMRWIGGPR